MEDPVLLDVDRGVATITLNRPERLNAMTTPLVEALLQSVEAAAADPAVSVVVLTGAGRGFCAGGDVSTRTEEDVAPRPSFEEDVAAARRVMGLTELLHDMPKATIAKVNGPCAGAGMAMACACDLRYAAESAVFTTAFLTVGASGDHGLTWTLPRLIGATKARELFLLPDRLRADEAERIGLVTRTVPDADLTATVDAVAERLAASPPLALRLLKQNLVDAEHVSLGEVLDLETERLLRCFRDDESTAAARRFLEKGARPAQT
jgi:2-(1,2-epoxy-1,2-dihydrophenyl)acetyl-CoA isomerase